jgi:hypothetical protein
MIKLLLPLSLVIYFLLPVGVVQGQTDAGRNFSNGVNFYNQLNGLTTHAATGGMAETDITNMETYYRSGKMQLDSALLDVPDSQKNVVNYFAANLNYSYAVGLLKKGDKKAAFEILKSTEIAINTFTSEAFPFEYETNKLFHIVRWSDFEQVQCAFNAVLGGAYFDDNQFDSALEYLRKANDVVCLESIAFINNSYRLLKIKQAKNEEDDEMLDVAVGLFSAWNQLDDISREQLTALKDVPALCADIIEKILVKDPSLSADGEFWARTSRLLTDEKMEERAIAFAVNAIKSGYKDKEFLLSLFPQAQNAGNKMAARLAADKFAGITADTDCSDFELCANQYLQLEEKDLAEKYRQKAEKCNRNSTKTEKITARDGGLYLGTYISPLFRSDFGAVAAMQTRRWMMEVSWQTLDDRRDKLYDLRIRGVDGAADQRVRWDGYYTHLAVSKLSGKKGGKNYSGLLFGYNQRLYQPINVLTITNKSGDLVNVDGAVTFKPKEERYILMLNSGRHSYGRLLASDFFFGFGGAWSRFERGNDSFDNKDYTYEHPLIDGRKSGRISLMARVGVTVGLQVGNKTFEKKVKKKSHS